MTVRENVAYSLTVKSVPKAEAHARAEGGLELVGLAGFGDRLLTCMKPPAPSLSRTLLATRTLWLVTSKIWLRALRPAFWTANATLSQASILQKGPPKWCCAPML